MMSFRRVLKGHAQELLELALLHVRAALRHSLNALGGRDNVKESILGVDLLCVFHAHEGVKGMTELNRAVEPRCDRRESAQLIQGYQNVGPLRLLGNQILQPK